jgi:recombination protein RecR
MDALDQLIGVLAKLPAIGRRSAERIAVRLMTDPARKLVKQLADALQTADRNIASCRICGLLTERDRDPCRICSDPRRDRERLCVVEDPGDVLALEQSGAYRGLYHVLGGRLSPMNQEGPADTTVDRLLERVRQENIGEVILALNTGVESDATASWLKHLLEAAGARATRMGTGLPVGSGISYVDSLTLQRAFEGRR